MHASRSRAAGAAPAKAAALTRDRASPSSVTGRCDSLSASSISDAAVAAAHARSYAELPGLADCEPRAGSDTCASAVLRLEGAHLTVELVGDVRELIDRRVVQRRLVAGTQLVLPRLEVEALEIGLHVAVVLLDGFHGRDHFLLRGRTAVGNLARRLWQPALIRVGLEAQRAGGRQSGQGKDSLRGLHGWVPRCRHKESEGSAEHFRDGREQALGVEGLDQPAGRSGGLALLLALERRFGGEDEQRH